MSGGMPREGEEYTGTLPAGVKKLRRWKGESEKAFNQRKARTRSAAAEQAAAARDAAHQAKHPSDAPLEKFKRVWEGDERDRVFKNE